MLQGVVLRRETQPYDSPQIQLQEQPKGCITRTKPLCLFPPPLSVTKPPLIEASPITPQWRLSLSEVWSKATLQVWSYGGKWWLVLMIIFLSKTLFSFTYLIIVLNWGLHVHSARVRVLEPVWTWLMLATFGSIWSLSFKWSNTPIGLVESHYSTLFL